MRRRRSFAIGVDMLEGRVSLTAVSIKPPSSGGTIPAGFAEVRGQEAPETGIAIRHVEQQSGQAWPTGMLLKAAPT
jgi:hypothetical protein